MKTKTFVMLILLFITVFVLGFIGFQFFLKQNYKPGVDGIAKVNTAILYCSYGEGVKNMVDVIANKIKSDVIEIKPAVPYPADKAALYDRIKKENEGLSAIVLDNIDINIRKYKLLIFATPIIQDKPCPVIQKLINDNEARFKNKAVSTLVMYDEAKDTPKATMDFFYYRLHEARQKPSYLTLSKGKEQLEYEIKLWFDEMEFKREELR